MLVMGDCKIASMEKDLGAFQVSFSKQPRECAMTLNLAMIIQDIHKDFEKMRITY
jgi:hypothetical protein